MGHLLTFPNSSYRKIFRAGDRRRRAVRRRGFADRSFKRGMRSIATVATAMRKLARRPRFRNRHSFTHPLGRLQLPTQPACALHRVVGAASAALKQRVPLPTICEFGISVPVGVVALASVSNPMRDNSLPHKPVGSATTLRPVCGVRSGPSGSSHPCHLNRARLGVNHARNPVAPNYLFLGSRTAGKSPAGCLTLATRSITLVTYVSACPS